MLVRLLAWIETAVAGPWQAVTTTLAVMGFMAGLPISSSVFASGGEPAHKKVDCALPSIARHLADPNGLGKRQTTILAAIDFGPELLYRTPHKVIATPYHRNSDGILGAYRIMTAIDPVEVRACLRARGVGLILLCPGSNHEANFAQPRNADTFYQRLLNGRAPDWLREKPLSPLLSTRFKLFEVTG